MITVRISDFLLSRDSDGELKFGSLSLTFAREEEAWKSIAAVFIAKVVT